MRSTKNNTHRAFSLIEVMIAVVIIGLMAGLVTYATGGYLDRAKRKRAAADVNTLSGAVDQYYLATGKYPQTQDGLKGLVPQFIKVLQNDPWGKPYQYIAPGKRNLPFEIMSLGADGREGGSGADADVSSGDVEAPAKK